MNHANKIVEYVYIMCRIYPQNYLVINIAILCRRLVCQFARPDFVGDCCKYAITKGCRLKPTLTGHYYYATCSLGETLRHPLVLASSIIKTSIESRHTKPLSSLVHCGANKELIFCQISRKYLFPTMPINHARNNGL